MNYTIKNYKEKYKQMIIVRKSGNSTNEEDSLLSELDDIWLGLSSTDRKLVDNYVNRINRRSYAK